MKYKLLVGGFLVSIVIMFVITSLALHTTQQILTSFETQGRRFQKIATAATEASSYVKRAEGHLLLYLNYDREIDKIKYPQRIASLQQQITQLDQVVRNPDARAMVKSLQSTVIDLESVGRTLMTARNDATTQTETFDMDRHRELVLQYHTASSAIRKTSVDLATLEIQLESNLRAIAISRTVRLRTAMIILICVAAGFTAFLGLVLHRLVRAMQSESRKLKTAMDNVKVLSGLLPICMSCKKIRDDKGYWNQLEGYILEHSEAEFSHGICPDCQKILYPDYIPAPLPDSN